MALEDLPPLALSLVVVPAPPAPPADVLQQVADIWTAETARRGDTLFDGRLFSIIEREPGRITGWFAPYSWYVAQRRDPALLSALNVRPMGVTGIMLCADGLVLGRRGSMVESDAGLWECAPSGGIDGLFRDTAGGIDLAGQILAELEEETGLSPALLAAPPLPVALTDDPAVNITDVGLLLRLRATAAEIAAAFAPLAGREYAELTVVPLADVPAFLARQADRVGTVSRGLLAQVLS